MTTIPVGLNPQEYIELANQLGLDDFDQDLDLLLNSSADYRNALLNAMDDLNTGFNSIDYSTETAPLFDLTDITEHANPTDHHQRYIRIHAIETLHLDHMNLNPFLAQINTLMLALHQQIGTNVNYYKVVMIDNDNSHHFQTTYHEGILDAYIDLEEKLQNSIMTYNTNTGLVVSYVDIQYLINLDSFILGSDKSYIEDYKDYTEFSYKTHKNCVFVSIYLALHPDPKYFENPSLLMKTASKWKTRLNLPKSVEELPCMEHLGIIANMTSTYITTLDEDYVEISEFGDPLDHPVLLRTNNNHASVLIHKNTIESIDPLLINDPIIYKKSSNSRLIHSKKRDKTINNKIGTYDIETFGEYFTTYMVGLAYLKDNKTITKQFISTSPFTRSPLLQFMDYLEQSDLDNYTFYAHNGGKFDLIRLIKECLWNNSNYTIISSKCIELDSSWIRFGVIVGKNTIWFKDTYRILSNSLKDLTNSFNVKHKKLETDNMMFVAESEDLEGWINVYTHLSELKTYNLHDCLGLLEVIIEFQDIVFKSFGVDITKYMTAASISKAITLTAYYNPSRNPVFTLDQKLDAYVRKSYWGGRNECFKLGLITGPLYYYDFTSLYPYAGTCKLPYGKPTYFTNNYPNFNQVACVIRVKMRSISDKLPAQCHMQDGKLVFPVFAEWAEKTITGVEYLYGLETKMYEYQILDGYWWNQDTWLKRFFTQVFDKKKQASMNNDTAGKYIWKLIVNSGYGNWGFVWRDKESVELSRTGSLKWLKHLKQGNLIDYKDDGHNCIMKVRTTVRSDCNVAVASYITANARILLHRLMLDIKNHNHEVYYCDTDSIITNLDMSKHELGIKWKVEQAINPMNNKPFDGENLGDLKNEIHKKYTKRSFAKAIIVGCKMYSLISDCFEQNINKLKGYKRSSGLSGDIIRKLLHNENVIQTQVCIPNNRTSYLNGFNMCIRKIIKKFRMLYTKGEIISEGELLWKTQPLLIGSYSLEQCCLGLHTLSEACWKSMDLDTIELQ